MAVKELADYWNDEIEKLTCELVSRKLVVGRYHSNVNGSVNISFLSRVTGSLKRLDIIGNPASRILPMDIEIIYFMDSNGLVPGVKECIPQVRPNDFVYRTMRRIELDCKSDYKIRA